MRSFHGSILFVIACLVGTSYASFGTATCASNFRLVSFSDWGEDTSVTQNTGTNAAALKVLRWKCICQKYEDGDAADGDCTFSQNKLNSDGTTSTTETEFVQSLAYYNFNVWAPAPRVGTASATQGAIYDLWNAHQTERTADIAVVSQLHDRKKMKLKSSMLLQESTKSEKTSGQNEPSPRLKESSKSGNPGAGKCWSGTCEQRASNTFKIGECSNGDVEAPGNCPDGTYQSPGISDQTPGTSIVYKQRIRPGNFEDFRNGDDNPQNHNGGGGMVDFACPGNSGHTDAQEQYCMDWSIPSGCDMLDIEQIRDGHIDVKARFQELAAELVPGCNPIVTVKQFWSTTGMSYNGEQATKINEYQIPFSQKYNAYYVATWFEGYSGAVNRFRNAIQILTCEDESVSSQVFADACLDGYNFGCSGDLTCAVVDSIWRKIVGEIHRKILLG